MKVPGHVNSLTRKKPKKTVHEAAQNIRWSKCGRWKCAANYWRWADRANDKRYGPCEYRAIDEPAWFHLEWGLEHPDQCGRIGQPRCESRWKREPNLWRWTAKLHETWVTTTTWENAGDRMWWKTANRHVDQQHILDGFLGPIIEPKYRNTWKSRGRLLTEAEMPDGWAAWVDWILEQCGEMSAIVNEIEHQQLSWP
jgi:hypothetical protein